MLSLLLVFLLQIPVQSAIRLPKFDLGGNSNDKQRIKLDLSGRWRGHLLGPKMPSESLPPLFEVEHLPVSLSVATDFDLSQQMSPIRWLATLLWMPRGRPVMSIAAGRDKEQNVAVQVEAPLGKLFSCQTRYADDEPSQIIFRMTPNARLQTQLHFVDTPSLTIASGETNADSDWWIPKVSVTALGRLNSQWDTCAYHRDDRHVQLRLTVRRNLGWSILGKTLHDAPETWCTFQIQGSHHPMYITAATVSGQLDDLSSWGLCLRQSIASSRLWPTFLRSNHPGHAL